jgi:flagellar basal body rod protein FlgG
MDGIAWASSAMVAARTRLEIATSNLANASTNGFHAALARGRMTANGVEIERVRGGNVDAIGAMIDELDAERSFESAEKAVSAIDETRQKSSNDVGRVK